MVPASWGENKETYQLPDSLAGKTVILHTNDVHGAIDKYAKVAALRDECYDKGAHQVILLDAGVGLSNILDRELRWREPVEGPHR